jgi:hypothetical protein
VIKHRRTKVFPGAVMMLAFAAVNVVKAESKSIVILKSQHNLDFTQKACDTLLQFTDVDAVTRLLKAAPENDPSVTANKQIMQGLAECKSVNDSRELARRVEKEVADGIAANPVCVGTAAYIEGHDKYDGKLSEAAMQAEKNGEYWLLLIDYTPGTEIAAWSLFPEHVRDAPLLSSGRLVGEGTAAQIVEQVCSVVKRSLTIWRRRGTLE